MQDTSIPCGYPSCPNPSEPRSISVIAGIGKVEMSVDFCDSHYDLRDIDGDVIGWLKEEWSKRN